MNKIDLDHDLAKESDFDPHWNRQEIECANCKEKLYIDQYCTPMPGEYYIAIICGNCHSRNEIKIPKYIPGLI